MPSSNSASSSGSQSIASRSSSPPSASGRRCRRGRGRRRRRARPPAAEPDVEDVLRLPEVSWLSFSPGVAVHRGAVRQVRGVLPGSSSPRRCPRGRCPRRAARPRRCTRRRPRHRQPEVRGGGGQRLLEDLAADAHGDTPLGPAGELGGPGHQGRAQRVPGQLRFGVQPHRRQGGTVCGHLGLSSSNGLRARAPTKRRRKSSYLGQFSPRTGTGHRVNLDNSLGHTRD